ncbi:hypothetical protein Jinkies_37 [Arthrobacter phage Jinkies]|uniref:Uncharacterized protein n=1 Tax=Arthrobacter phage Jinkies TaxID=2743903 RepID=A0A7S6BFZ5_9CAUD|nr:hypothetical protein Jinkies_37 [Arthrobacter phage Jinkies]
MLPDRADTTAVVEQAVKNAAEYWGTEFDTEHAELNKLHVADVVITRQEFAELVEARIAVEWADNHADLSRYGGDDDCDWFTRAEFIRQQREEWIVPIMARVVRRTRDARQFETEQVAA